MPAACYAIDALMLLIRHADAIAISQMRVDAAVIFNNTSWQNGNQWNVTFRYDAAALPPY